MVVGVDDEIAPAADVVDMALVVGAEPEVLGAPVGRLLVHRQALGEDEVQAEEHPPREHRPEGVPAVSEEHVGERGASADHHEPDPVATPPDANGGRQPPERRAVTVEKFVHSSLLGNLSLSALMFPSSLFRIENMISKADLIW